MYHAKITVQYPQLVEFKCSRQHLVAPSSEC